MPDLSTLSLGRELRSTKNPMNDEIFPLTDLGSNELPFGSQHVGGAFFLLADGHVRFVSENIHHPSFQSLSTRAGGESVQVP
jgi:uncharacterized protein DUF1559